MRTRGCLVAVLAAVTAACNGSIYHPSHAPRLALTSFLAFGDSVTEGGDPNTPCPAGAARLTPGLLALTLPALVPATQSYPGVLQQLLRDQFVAQAPVVANRGLSGEFLADGLARLPGVLLQEAPQVTLLVEGANDVNNGVAPAQMASSLAKMIQLARARGNTVFVGTVLPQRPIGVNGSCRGFGAAGVVAANDEIKSTARAEGAVLVDLYEAFGGVPDPLIGRDGLHPTDAGYTAIARAFSTAISARLED